MQGKSAARSRFFVAWLAALIIVLPAVAAPALAAPAKGKATRVIRPLLPSPEKDAAIVVDGATGKVLYSRNPDAVRYPASLTKMMTLYMLFDALEKGTISLDTPLVASARAAEQQPTKLSIKVGGSIAVDTAIKAVTVLSANDVAVVIAEALGGGSENTFAAMMTEKAHQLGMTSTSFHNASGLPNLQQVTTARDMAILGRHLAYDFPQYYHYFVTPSFTYNRATYHTHNNLIAAFEGTDGIKTGYTQLSGFNLVTSAVRENKHVVGVVMGGPTAATRDREMMRLISATFQVAEENPTLLADANVPWKGGKGPGGDLFRANPGEDNVLLAVLERKGPQPKATGPVLVASAAPPTIVAVPTLKPALPGAQITQVAMVTPLLKPAPFVAAPFQLASLKSLPLRFGPAPVLNLAASSAQIAQGDSAGTPPALFTPKPVISNPVKRWAVQIGAFATETLAEAQLAAFAKHGVDVIGEAEKLVVPVPAVGGKTLYRARFGTFEEDQARNICKRMTQRGQTCFAAPQA